MNKALSEVDETETLVESLDELEAVTESEDESPDDEPSFEKNWSDEEENEARLLGWKDPDEWQGNKPPGYIDNPTDFLERLQRSTPFRKMQELSDQKIRKLESVMEAQTKRIQERAHADYKAKLAQIAAGQRKAVENADTDEFDRLEQERGQLAPPEPEAEQPKDSLEPFYEKHEWLTDAVMRRHGADTITAAMQAGVLSPNAPVQQQVEYAETQVKKYFPHLFQTEEAPKPKLKPKVDGGGLAQGRKKESFEGLPKDVRDTFARQVKNGVFEDTKEDREFFYNEYQNG